MSTLCYLQVPQWLSNTVCQADIIVNMPNPTRSLSNHIDMQTHASSAFDYYVTLTFDLLPKSQYMPSDCHTLYAYQVWCWWLQPFFFQSTDTGRYTDTQNDGPSHASVGTPTWVITSGSAMAEGPRDALVSRNSATTKHPTRQATCAF